MFYGLRYHCRSTVTTIHCRQRQIPGGNGASACEDMLGNDPGEANMTVNPLSLPAPFSSLTIPKASFMF